MPITIHESSYVDDGADIGDGTKIWHFSHVMGGAVVGRDCVLGQNVFVASGVRIGNTVKIQNNVSVYEGVTLEDGVFCGPSAVFTNVSTPRSEVSRKSEYEITVVGKAASIGANATIVCGNKIGHHALIGAGSVVTSEVKPHALMLGVPARHMGWVCACGEVLRIEEITPEWLKQVLRESGAINCEIRIDMTDSSRQTARLTRC